MKIIKKIFNLTNRFLSFAKNMGKSLSNKYGQKLLDSAKKSTTDAYCIKKSNSKNCTSDW